MRRSRHYSYWFPIVGIAVLLALFAATFFPPRTASEAEPSEQVQRAWRRAQQAGTYRFATEIEQTTYPAPKLVNVGRSSRKETLHIEGQTNLPERTLLMSLWQGGGSVLNARDGVEVRIEGDRAYGRQIGGTWQEINDFSNAFAPGSDLMAYLAGAKNVKRLVSSEGRTDDSSLYAPRYTLCEFEVDGPAFARHLRDQLEQLLVEKGELPAGLSLDSSSAYRGVTGQGEIWIDGDGLPLRLTVDVKYPQEQNGERVEAQIKTDFSGFDRQRLAASQTWIGRVASALSLPGTPRDWQGAAWQTSLILGCFGLLLVLTTQGNSKKVYAVLVITLTLSMVVTPLLEGRQAAAFFERQSVKQTEIEQQQKAQAATRKAQEQLTTSDWDPHRNPLAANVEQPVTNDEGRMTGNAPSSFVGRPSSASSLSPASQSTSGSTNLTTACTEDEQKRDTDQDGLMDCQEKTWRTNPNDPDSDHDGLLDSWEVLQLGTNPTNADSDGDQISDWAEVTGFKDRNNKWWYLNPTSADSSGDGRIDTLECAARKDITLVNNVPTVITKTVASKAVSIAQGQVCQDTDSDGTPDVFDWDDDNDGVGDRIDSSPTTVLGQAAPFTRDNPFSLVVNNLNTKPKPLPSSPTEYYPVFVDLQLRPVVTDHLTYALNVLDWPSGDEKGQIQRRQDNNSTFATYMSAEDLQKDSRPENGDLRLVPMLEVEVSGDNVPLPLTTTLRTSVQTQGITATWPVSTQPPVLTAWISATIVMTGYLNNTKTILHFMTQGGQTADEARIYQGTCNGGGTFEYPTIGGIINDRKTILDRNLNTLADGKHVIVLQKAGYTPACVPIGDIPNGPFTDKMIDQEPFKAYGVSVRDKGDANHTLLMYVPLNVVPDETGGGRAAFGAHIPYQPNGPSLGTSQKVRVIWMVQMLTDRCKPMPGDYASDWAQKWCEYSSAWELDNTQIVHVYNEDWYLTGLSVREDHGLNVAIAWEDPSAESEQDRKFDDWLWLMARGLEDAYISGRDQDDDKIRDIGVVTYTDGVALAETSIAGRFDSPIAAGVTITDRLGVPLTATLQVQNYAYPHQDYVAQIMMNETVKVLNNNFTAYKDVGANAPTLMFIRQERYRAADLSMTDGSVAITGTTTTISLLPRQVETQGSLSWAPFRYQDGKWQSYPADAYWDLMQVRFKDRFPQDSTLPADYREDITQGEITIAKAFYLSIMQGRVGLLDVGNRPVYKFTPEQTDAYVTNMVATAIKGVGSGLRAVVKQIGEAIVNMYEIVAMVDKMLASAAGKLYTPLTQSQKLFQAIGQGIKGYLSDKLSIFKKLHDALGTKGAIALGIAVAVVAVAVVTLTIVGFVLDSKVASFVVSTAANVLMATVSVALAAYTIYQYATSALMELSKGAKIAGVVGLVIVIVATWAAFIATAVMGPRTLTAVLSALGKAIAATITAIVMFAINFIPVVGQVITAIILAIDSIVMALCGAFGWDKTEPGQVFCGGISGLITWAVTPYGYNIMVDFADPNRLQFGQFDYTIVYPEKGMAVGNQFHYTATLTNSINLIGIPWDWKAASYAWQYNTQNLASSTFKYEWQTEAQDIHENLSRNQQNPAWQYTNGGRPLYAAIAPASGAVTMTEAGINNPVQLYMAEGYAVPAQECILIPNPLGLALTGAPIPYVTMIPVCYIRDAKGTNSMDMGQQYVFDVFPATLSEFYQSVPQDGGYSLAWGQAGSIIFPRQKDFDGDGLRNKMDGGSDPDDSKWDSDGDGLSDYYEMQHRSDPNLVDTDADELSDFEEARLGTDPTRKDSDGDGLTDKEEVEGWEFVYAVDASGNQLRTRVTSDPLDPDTDSDGLPDFKEKAFGLNPRVVSDPTVLALESQMWESGAPQLLLHLDEASGAAAFADASGYNHPAACTANRCPAAGMDGRYGLAAGFDGNDLLTANASISGKGAFAVAAWVKTNYAAKQLIVNQVTPESGVPYSLEVLANGRVGWWTYGWGGSSVGDTYGFNMTSAHTVGDNQWHHVVGIRESDGTGRIYIDGVLDSTASAPARDLRAGSAYVGSTFVGLIDEVAVFDRALTQADVQTLMTARYNPNDMVVSYGNGSLNYQATVQNKLMDRYAQGLLSLNNTVPSVLNTNSIAPVPFVLQPQELKVMSGTVQVASSSASRAVSLTQVAGALITDWREQSGFAEMWLPLNEPVTTTTFLDHSGNVPPRNGLCSGSTCPTRQAPGYFGYAAQFDGVNDRIVISDSTGFDFGAGAFSISMWFTKENTTRGDALSWKNPQGDNFTILLDSDNQLKVWLQVNGSGGWVTQNGGPFTRDAWYHMAVVRDGNGNWTTYINGEAKGSGASAANMDNINPGTPIWLGSNHDDSNAPTNPFKGSLDEVLVYKRALTAAEVRALYSKPVLRLQLDEGTRNLSPLAYNTLADSSGFRNHGWCFGNTCPAAGNGVSGNGASFDGSDYFSVNPNPSLDLSGGKFTLGAWVYPFPQPEPQSTACPFTAKYYNNVALNGTPVTQCEGWEGWANPADGMMVNHNWGAGSPAPGIPADRFSATWEGTFWFPAGSYDFTIRSSESTLDMMQMNVDGAAIASAIFLLPVATRLNYSLSEGWHTIKVSYVHYMGNARAQFTFSPPFVQGILGSSSGTSSAYPSLQTVGRKLRIGFGDKSSGQWQSWVTTDPVLTANAWNHAVATSDGSQLNLYVNGARVSNWGLGGATPTNAKGFDVGRSSSSGSAWIDKFYVVDEADAAGKAEVSLRWNGDKICHTEDSKQKCNWGSLTDGTTVDVDVSKTVGTSDTLEAWEDDDGWNDDPLCTGGSNCGDNKGFRFSTNKPGMRYLGFDWQGDKTGGLPEDNTHIRLYMGKDGSQTSDWAFYNQSMPLRGMLDEVTLYKRPLDAAEVQELYLSPFTALYLRLDDPPGSESFENAVDLSRQGNAYCTGAACPTAGVSGRIGQAVLFDGVSDGLDTPLVTDQASTSQGVTMMAWVYPASTSTGRHQVISSDNTGYDWSLLREGGDWAVFNGSSSVDTGASVDVNRWQHIAAVFRPGQGVRFFKNGSLVNTSSTPGYDTSTSPIVIGRHPNTATGQYFDGRIDDVRVFSRALNDTEIQTMFQAAPVLLMHLDDPKDATQFTDDSGNNNGSCSAGACPLVGEAVKGQVGTAAEFDGMDDTITVPDNSTLDLTPFSVGAWVMPTAIITRGQQTLIDKGSNYSLFISPGSMTVTLSFQANCGTTRNVTTTANLMQNQWNYVMGTYDGTTARLYINGYEQGHLAATGSACANTQALRIGGRTSPIAPFVGRIDEVTLYDHALSEFEVRDIFLYQGKWVEERRSQTVVVDNDNPVSVLRSYTDTMPYLANQDYVMHIEAQDATSRVAMVELGVRKDSQTDYVWTPAPRCMDAAGGNAWCPTPNFEPTGEGRYRLQTRAIDVVGHTETPTRTYVVYVDSTAPNISASLPSGSIVTATLHPTLQNAWAAHLSGTVSDPQLPGGYNGSGVKSDSVQATLLNLSGIPAGQGMQRATVAGNTWTVDYVFFEANPTGAYTLTLEAADNIGHQRTVNLRVYVDAIAPAASLDVARTPPAVVTSTTQLQGDVTERPVSVVVMWTTDNAGNETGLTIQCNGVTRYSVGSGTFYTQTATYDWSGDVHQGATCQVNLTDTGGNGGATGMIKVCGAQVASWSASYGAGTTVPFTADSTSCGSALSVAGVSQVQVGFVPNMPGSPHYQESTLPGEVLHWLFEDQPDKNGILQFHDVTGQGHTGTCTGTRCPTVGEPGHLGSAAHFDGVDDSVSLANFGVFTTTTVSAWIYRTGAKWARETIVSYKEHGNCGFTLSLNQDGQRQYPRFFVRVGGVWYAAEMTQSIPLYTWVQLAGTYDGQTIRLYRDGQEAASVSAPGGMQQCNQTTAIGSRSSQNMHYFPGLMDEVRIFDHALSATEIKALYRGAGPVLALPFDEAWATDGTALEDKSGWTHQVTLHSGAGDVNNKAAPGKVGPYALGADGVDDYVSIGPNAGLDLSSGRFTQAAWVYPTPQDSGLYPILGSATYGLSEYRYPLLQIVNRTQLQVGFGDGTNSNSYTTGSVLTENAWNHIATTFDGITYTMYVNGVARATTAQFAGRLPYPTQRLDVGRGTTANVPTCAVMTGMQFTPQTSAPGYRVKINSTVVYTDSWVVPGKAVAIDPSYDFCGSATMQVEYWQRPNWVSLGTHTVGTTPGSGNHTFSGSGKSATLNWNIVYASADLRYWRGRIDDVRLYPRALAPLEVQALAQSGWQATTLAPSGGTGVPQVSWNSLAPAGVEGSYRVDVRGGDMAGHLDNSVQGQGVWRGDVDTLAPRVSLTRTTVGARYYYTATAQDYNLLEQGFSSVCGAGVVTGREYFQAPWYAALSGQVTTSTQKLYRLTAACDLPTIPSLVEVGAYDTPGLAKRVVISGTYAYVADEQRGLRIVDISDPRRPRSASAYQSPHETPVLGIAVSGDIAYVAGQSWLEVVNVSNPRNPQYLGGVDSSPGFFAGGISLNGNYAYLANSQAGLVVYDVSAPGNPSFVSDYMAWGTQDVAISANYAYVTLDNGQFHIVDISNPVSLHGTSVYTLPAPAYGVAVSGTYAYVADDTAGLRILNVSNPASPFEVGSYNTPGSAHGIAVIGNHVLVADGLRGLRLLDVSTPGSPQSVGYVDTPGFALDVTTSGDDAFVADDSKGLRVTNFVPSPAEQVTACDIAGNCTRALLNPTTLQAASPASTQAADDNMGVAISNIPPVLDSTSPTTIEGEAWAITSSLQALTVTVDGALFYTNTWGSGAYTQAVWSTTDWTPTEGAHSIGAALTAWDGNTANDAISVIVDVQPPSISITPTVLTSTVYHAPKTLDVTGLVTDVGGVENVQVVIEGPTDSVTNVAGIDSDTWLVPWDMDPEALPDGTTYTVTAMATDVAGHEAAAVEAVLVDIVPPAPVTLTLSSSGNIVLPGTTLRELSLTLTLTWTESSDGSGLAGYLAQWTAQITEAVNSTVNAYGPLTRTDVYTAAEANKVWAQVASHDIYGLQSAQSIGPVYVDSLTTPDYVILNDPDGIYRGWMDSGCSLVGVDRRMSRNAMPRASLSAEQKFYVTWNTEALRLAWTGAHWDTDGEQFIYLDLQPGGAITAFNPYEATATDTIIYLPGVTPTSTVNAMAADYVVWVRDARTALLLRWNGNDWEWQSALTVEDGQYHFDASVNGGQADLYVPFDLLGITDPTSTTLDMVALASEKDALRLWAVQPPANPANSSRAGSASAEGTLLLSYRYHWSSLGSGVCPNLNYRDTDLAVSISTEPDGAIYNVAGGRLPLLALDGAGQALVGDGQVITFTVRFSNRGTFTATGALLDVSSYHALRLPSGTHLPGEMRDQQVVSLGDVGPGAEGSATFTAMVDKLTAQQYYATCSASNPDYLCTDHMHLARLEAQLFDDSHDPSGPPIDWIGTTHLVDLYPPEFMGVQQPEYLVPAGSNTLLGYAYDASAVPTVTLVITPPIGAPTSLTCPDDTPQDGQWSCGWNTTGASDGDTFNVSVQATDAFGQAGGLSKPQPLVVDTVPPAITLDLTATQLVAGSVIKASDYTLFGQISDNRGLGRVEACVNSGPCAPAGVQLIGAGMTHLYDDEPDAPAAIGGCGSPLARTFSVPESFTLGEVSLGLNAEHPDRDDIQVELQSPSGTRVRLLYNDGITSTHAANYDVLLNDAAAGVYNAGSGDDVASPRGAYDRQARPFKPLQAFNGEGSSGTWTLTVCDLNPSVNDGAYQRSRLMLKPRDTAARSGEWSITVRNAEPLDYVKQTVDLYGIDLVGNRTAGPLSFSLTVDNVPPLVTATQVVNSTPLTTTVLVLTGTVSDGGQVSNVFLTVQSPDNVYDEVAAQDGNAWQYDLRPVSTGRYLLWVNAVDLAGNVSTAGPFEVDVTSPSQIYMPIVVRSYASAPDLVVDRIIATSNNVQVVVKNQGDRPVSDEFWVDLYVNPNPPPTGVNQTWGDGRSTQGVVWGVTAPALPSLQPGGVLTLTVGDAYYWSSLSRIAWPLPVGTLIYAQADSANAGTTYGAVLENHEITGGEYNNIASTNSTSTASAAQQPTGGQASSPSQGKLPPRP